MDTIEQGRAARFYRVKQWEIFGSWGAVLLVIVMAAAVGVFPWRASGRKAAGWFLATWLVLTGCLGAFFLASVSAGDATCIGTTVDATREVQVGDLGATDDPVARQCTANARARYLVGLTVYLGLAGAGAVATRRMGSIPGGGH
jgi:hypothetical protein